MECTSHRDWIDSASSDARACGMVVHTSFAAPSRFKRLPYTLHSFHFPITRAISVRYLVVPVSSGFLSSLWEGGYFLFGVGVKGRLVSPTSFVQWRRRPETDCHTEETLFR